MGRIDLPPPKPKRNLGGRRQAADSTSSRAVGFCIGTDRDRFSQHTILPNSEAVRLRWALQETVGLHVIFAGELARVPADGFPVGLIVAAKKEFDLKPHNLDNRSSDRLWAS